MARHVTIRRTQTTTEELRPPWVYRVQGALGLVVAAGALLFGCWLLAGFNL